MDECLKKGIFPVYTIHEFQGKQEDHVVVVRISTKKEEIYSSEEHALVAFSRHKKTLTYYSPISDDALGKLISSTRFHPITVMKKCLVSRESVKSPKVEGLIPERKISSVLNSRIRLMRRESDDFSGGYPEMKARAERKMVRLEGGAYRIIEQPLKNFNNVTEAIYSVTKKYRDYDVPTMIPIPEFNYDPLLTGTSVLVPNLEMADVSLLQIFYDQVLPGNSVYDYRFDPEVVQNGDLIFNLEDTSYNPDYKCNSFKTERYDRLRPMLRTAVPINRPNTQVESLLAMIKRNQSVPDLGGYSDVEALADTMIKRFNHLIKPEAMYLFDIYKTQKILPNSVSVRNWLLTQTTEALSQIEQPEDILVRQHNVYNFMIKSNVKPQLHRYICTL